MSADLVLGVPFNIASYALLTMMVAQVVDMVPGEFIHTFGDVHIYSNHLQPNDQGESLYTQLDREPYPLPKIIINPNVKDIFDFKVSDFELENYQSHPSIKLPVAI